MAITTCLSSVVAHEEIRHVWYLWFPVIKVYMMGAHAGFRRKKKAFSSKNNKYSTDFTSFLLKVTMRYKLNHSSY